MNNIKIKFTNTCTCTTTQKYLRLLNAFVVS